MARIPLVVGNWKMELSHVAALEATRALKKMLSGMELSLDVVVCPAYPQLPDIAKILKDLDHVSVGAQHVHWEEKGAVTGAVSVQQVSPFARYAIVGHSETRRLMGLDDDQVREAVALLIRHGITPVVCVGETWEERQAEKTVAAVTRQVESLLAGITRPALRKLVVAYEPVWAISASGTGEQPEPQEVAEIILLIRKLVAARFEMAGAEAVRVLYGGSVKPDNVEAFLREPGVDGVLVGSASVTPVQFVDIVKKVQAVCS